MKEKVDELSEWVDKVSKYELPDFSTLPRVPLYMDQVVQYVNEVLEPLSSGAKRTLTSFMVNNYVKAGIIKEPDKKKYNVEHLGYLLAITILKETLSMSELATLIEMDGQVSSDKSVLYGFYSMMLKDILHKEAGLLKVRIDRYEGSYAKDKKEKGEEYAETMLRDKIALIAFRMSIQSEVYRLLSHALLAALDEDLHGADTSAEKATRENDKTAMRAEEKEASRLAHAKARKKKETMKAKGAGKRAK
jgi:hypothetical protein